jgi:Ca-activated chloride channel family protein
MTRPIDETLLTAYALDECSPEEAARVEAALRDDPALREELDQLRELAALAEEALLAEPVLHAEQRARIMEAAQARERLLEPVRAPVPLPPPTEQEQDPEEVVQLRRKRRRIWALRGSAVAAVAAVALASVTVPMLRMGDAPNRAKVQRSPSIAASPASPAQRRGAERERAQLLEKLLSPMDQPDAPRMAEEARREWRPVTPDMRNQLETLGYLGDESQPLPGPNGPVQVPSGEGYNPIEHNPYRLVTDEPLSTFSIDVDTASYSNVRRFLEHHTLPPASAVRIEELINYFDYDYAPPRGDEPFSTHVKVASCPWNPQHRLARIAIQGRVIDESALPPSNLVFLLDVSGSMGSANKLPLVKQAIGLLVRELDERDRVAIVVYAGASGLVLPSTSGEDDATILRALERLEAGGGTAGAAGIELAYQTAVANFIEGGANRVILATDGDFNVGVSSQGELIELIEDRAETGVYLSVLGFGMGNLQDGTLEQLADHGNGNYAYIDDLDEARKVLVTERGGTLVTIAKDVKIQVELNPMEVHAYRLIGYENRALAAQDFDDDTKDAGEIGAGHSVTALYEIVPAGADLAVPGAPVLKYQRPTGTTDAAASGELMTVKLRYKQPDGQHSRLISVPVRDGGAAWGSVDGEFRFAAAVASFGMLLRDDPYRGEASWQLITRLVGHSAATHPNPRRAEFMALVRRAQELRGELPEPDLPR